MSEYIDNLISVYAHSIFVSASGGLLTEGGVVNTMNTLVREVEKGNTPKPHTDIKYVKCDKNIFDLREDFQAGNLYFSWVGSDVGYDKITDETTLLCRYEEGRLLYRVEKEVNLWKELSKFGIHEDSGDVNFNHMLDSDEFITMCCMVEELTRHTLSEEE